MKTLVSVTLLAFSAGVVAQDWYPSRYGADDELGAINNLSADKVLAASRLIKHGKAYSLGVPTGPDTPAYPPRWYRLTVLQPSPAVGDGAPFGTNRATGNDDLLNSWVGIGSQIDGLGHMGQEHLYYNGVHARDFVRPDGLLKYSVDKLPPIVSRGVLLDMTRHYGTPIVAEGTAFNKKEIDAAAAAAGIQIQSGDVVLFHTGWLNLAGQDDARFMAGEPGLGVEGARYLAGLGVVAVGADTWGLEARPSENPDEFFPAHVELLAKNGVYILEVMDTRELAADGATEFLFVLGQPKFVGAVQSIINPVAIR